VPPLHDIVPRDDNMLDVVTGDTVAGPFPTIRFAMQIASGNPPAPVPIAKFRHIQIIREVRRDA
jgi:hypothetical protein